MPQIMSVMLPVVCKHLVAGVAMLSMRVSTNRLCNDAAVHAVNLRQLTACSYL